MTSKVEEVARPMVYQVAEALWLSRSAVLSGAEGVSWKDLVIASATSNDAFQQMTLCLTGARAAIEAMRAATGAMVEAGAEEGSPYTITSPEWDNEVARTCDVWDAMIAAALTER